MFCSTRSRSCLTRRRWFRGGSAADRSQKKGEVVASPGRAKKITISFSFLQPFSWLPWFLFSLPFFMDVQLCSVAIFLYIEWSENEVKKKIGWERVSKLFPAGSRNNLKREMFTAAQLNRFHGWYFLGACVTTKIFKREEFFCISVEAVGFSPLHS